VDARSERKLGAIAWCADWGSRARSVPGVAPKDARTVPDTFSTPVSLPAMGCRDEDHQFYRALPAGRGLPAGRSSGFCVIAVSARGAPHVGQRPRTARSRVTSPRTAVRTGIALGSPSLQRPSRSSQIRIGPANSSWCSTRGSAKPDQRTRLAGFLFTDLFFRLSLPRRSQETPRFSWAARKQKTGRKLPTAKDGAMAKNSEKHYKETVAFASVGV
jgi:hypothetical protein